METDKNLENRMTARHSPNVLRKLKEAKVAIAGLGGLGSNIAVHLARIGVGELLLIDFDVVEASNLNRQNYCVEHIGQNKTDALKSQLEKINPFVKIITQKVKLTSDNAIKILDGYDVVCEAFDSADNKAMLINTLMENLPNIRIVSGSGMAGFGSSNSITTRRIFRNLYVCGDMQADSEIGIMSPRVGVCAAHQANMVLRLLLNIEDV